jgi:hypothetical protein
MSSVQEFSFDESRLGESKGYVLAGITTDANNKLSSVLLYDRASTGSRLLQLSVNNGVKGYELPLRHIKWFVDNTDGLKMSESDEVEVDGDISRYPILGRLREGWSEEGVVISGGNANLVITEKSGHEYKGVILVNNAPTSYIAGVSFKDNDLSSIGETFKPKSPFSSAPPSIPNSALCDIYDRIQDIEHILGYKSYDENFYLDLSYQAKLFGVNFEGIYPIDSSVNKFAEFSFAGFSKKRAVKFNWDKISILEWMSKINREYGTDLGFDSELRVLYRNNLSSSREPKVSSIKNLEIPEGVRAIGREAFSGFTEIAGVYFPDSLVEIGENAFRGCGLTEANFGCSLITIRSGAFADNNLSRVILPPSLVNVGKGAFSGNSEIKQAIIYRTGLSVATVVDVQKLIQLRGDSETVKRLAVADELDGVYVQSPSRLIEPESAYRDIVLKKVPEQYRDEDMRYLSEIASMELCEEIGLKQYNLTTAQVLASESEKERLAWSKYTGASKLGAKKSESSGDKKMEEVLQDLEEKFGTKGSAETIAYLKSLLETLTGENR